MFFRIILYHCACIDRFDDAKHLGEKLNEVRNKISEYILTSFYLLADEIMEFKYMGGDSSF